MTNYTTVTKENAQMVLEFASQAKHIMGMPNMVRVVNNSTTEDVKKYRQIFLTLMNDIQTAKALLA